ncbi:MAG: MBL fold metallo-hydrolase [Pseudanabaenaceae cyanobacterium]
MQLTWLDSNTWLWELGPQRVLVDPWLVGPLNFGGATWLFEARRRSPRPLPFPIDLILLSQGLPDHAHPPTLQAIAAQGGSQIPVVSSFGGAQVATPMGFQDVTVLAPGERWQRGGLTIQATLGAPTGPTVRENGYIVRSEDGSLYYEPHGYPDPQLAAAAPVDLAIVPVVDLNLPGLGPVIRGQSIALLTAQQLRPQALIPTAAGGDLEVSGWLPRFLQERGTVAQMQAALLAAGLATQVIAVQPGEPLPWQPV